MIAYALVINSKDGKENIVYDNTDIPYNDCCDCYSSNGLEVYFIFKTKKEAELSKLYTVNSYETKIKKVRIELINK